MAPKLGGGIRRIPVIDVDGNQLGWVMFDLFADFVNIEGAVYIPVTFSLRFTGDEQQPSLLVSYTVTQGAPVVSGVTVETKPGGRPVQRADLERVAGNLHAWTDMAVKSVMRHGETADNSLTIGGQALQPMEKSRAASTGRKRANQKMNDGLLREVAAIYLDPAPYGRYEAIQNHFDVSEPTAARYVRLARESGFLPARQTTKGN